MIISCAYGATDTRITTFNNFTWFFPPAKYQISDDKHSLTATSAKDTDFWRKTKYGFVHDNGNFYYHNHKIDQNFTMTVRFTGIYTDVTTHYRK
jgi:regulation of enolase protein 1 (concanavalin A-like superfamily)